MSHKREKGITLIALIITVIILLILAGAAISISVNGGDIFAKSQNAVTMYNSKVSEEEISVKNLVNYALIDIPDDIKVGDTVQWTPSGHYTWNKDFYASSDSGTTNTYASGVSGYTQDYIISTKELYSGKEAEKNTEINYAWNDGMNLDFTLNEWRVLSIDRESKSVRLVPTKVSIPVILQGATGYNNGVKLLNDACSNLYGGNIYGVEVHNINMDDIEGLMTSNVAAELIEAAKNTTPAYEERYQNNEGNTIDRNVLGEYTTNVVYPTIYAEEALRKITNSDDTINESNDGLGLSEARNSFISRENERVTQTSANGIISKTVKTIHPARTHYSMENTDFKNALGTTSGENIGNAELVLPDENLTNYWVSSRGIALLDSRCEFGIRGIGNGRMSIAILSRSHGSTLGVALGLFPIITLTSGELERRKWCICI